ncbi:Proteasome subunit alpha [Streptomyces californicus]
MLDEIDDVLEENAEDFSEVLRPEGRAVTAPRGARGLPGAPADRRGRRGGAAPLGARPRPSAERITAVGGNAEQISGFLDQRHRDGMTLAEALKLAVQALSREPGGGEREIPAERLEVAVLDRTRPQQRKFKRIVGRQLARLLEADAAAATPTDAPSDTEDGDTPDTDTGSASGSTKE